MDRASRLVIVLGQIAFGLCSSRALLHQEDES